MGRGLQGQVISVGRRQDNLFQRTVFCTRSVNLKAASMGKSRLHHRQRRRAQSGIKFY